MAKLLLVEDDENLRETVQDWLIFDSHIVEIAITGPEALEQLSISQYDLIMLDWYLPDINGIEVLKRYRASGGTAPVLMFSGRDTDEAKQAGLAAGATKFLTKPFRLQELSATIKEALASQKS